MKVFQSKLFGDIAEPENFLELLNLMIYRSDDKISGVRLWRGQGDIDWPLHSGAYRKLKLNSGTVFERDIVDYEQNLLLQARHRGYAKEDGIHISDVELLAKLQHHGAATRLVDFSKNSLISLWFCVQFNSNKTGLLLGVHTDYVGGGVEGELLYKSYDELIDGLSEHEHSMFIEAPVVSKRIAAQHGVFLYSDVAFSPMGSLKLNIKKKGINLFIAITPELKEECLKILRNAFDIRTDTLFPDLDGFAMANNVLNKDEMYRW